MKISVRNSLADMAAFILHVKARNRRFKRAPDTTLSQGGMNLLSAQLHPPVQELQVLSRTKETPTTASFLLAPAAPGSKVAFFRAGQYLALEAEINGIRVSRPFSISNSPDESLTENVYRITIRENEDGFFAAEALASWQTGTHVVASDPQGFFHYERLRDLPNIVCIAGGCGVTPFRAMVPDLLAHEPQTTVTLLYGFTDPEEEMFKADWTQVARSHPGRFVYVPVCSGVDGSGPGPAHAWKGERGFLTAELIRKYVGNPQEVSFFLCGPEKMHRFVEAELHNFSLRAKQVRRENFGGPGRRDEPGDVEITVRQEGSPQQTVVRGKASETVLVALERAGLNPPAMCRSGECGWCRSRLVSGSVKTCRDSAGLRSADVKFSHFHPCNSWPESDLSLVVPRNPRSGMELTIQRGGRE